MNSDDTNSNVSAHGRSRFAGIISTTIIVSRKSKEICGVSHG